MIRLGVAVRILGRAGLRARDGRRAEHAPHLSVSLLHVREVLLYLAEQRIGCYRLADDLAPYLTHPGMPQFGRQIEECADLLAELGALGMGPEGVLVLHAGGAYGDGAAALHRFAARFERLPAAARRRVAVEPDED